MVFDLCIMHARCLLRLLVCAIPSALRHSQIRYLSAALQHVRRGQGATQGCLSCHQRLSRGAP